MQYMHKLYKGVKMTTTKWTWIQEPYPPARFNENGCLLVWGGDVLRASPPVLSMWLQTVKFIAKKSKFAGLAQEIGFSAPNSWRLLWQVKGATQLCTSKKECNKFDLTAVSISDRSIIMIGPGGLLLIDPCICSSG